MKSATWFVSACAAALLACSTNSTGEGPGDDDDDDDDDDTIVVDASPGGPTPDGALPPPEANTIRLEIEPFDVQPGTERQVCKYFNLPVDEPIDVVKFRSLMSGQSHHFIGYKTIDPDTLTDPITPEQAETHDCFPAAGQLEGREAYVFGASSPEQNYVMPDGVAFEFVPNQVMKLEHHVINTTDDVIQGTVAWDLEIAPSDFVVEHYADVMWMGNWLFYIPPFEGSSVTDRCVFDYDIEVFRLTSHFHETGTHFSIEHWTPGGTTHYFDNYDWEHPEEIWFDPPIPIKSGEGIEWTCNWFNPGSTAILPGPNATDEMCIAFGIGYPKNSLRAEPINCNNPWWPG